MVADYIVLARKWLIYMYMHSHNAANSRHITYKRLETSTIIASLYVIAKKSHFSTIFLIPF